MRLLAARVRLQAEARALKPWVAKELPAVKFETVTGGTVVKIAAQRGRRGCPRVCPQGGAAVQGHPGSRRAGFV